MVRQPLPQRVLTSANFVEVAQQVGRVFIDTKSPGLLQFIWPIPPAQKSDSERSTTCGSQHVQR